MEEGVVVGHAILLVVVGTAQPTLHGRRLAACPGCAFLRQHQLVDLRMVRGADAAGRGRAGSGLPTRCLLGCPRA